MDCHSPVQRATSRTEYLPLLIKDLNQQCVNCYQKKVRCNWSEASPICSYCTSHGFECYLPDPTQPAQRTAVRQVLSFLYSKSTYPNEPRDKLAEFDARLRRLEREAKKPQNSLEEQNIDIQKSLTQSAIHHVQEPSFVLPDWEHVESSRFVRHCGSRTNSDESSTGFHTAVPEQPKETLVPLPALPNSSSSEFNTNAEYFSSEPQPVRRFRGETSPWNVLVNGTMAANIALITGSPSFNETVTRLADEERSTESPLGNYECDLFKELPFLSTELAFHYAEDYATEAPFPIVFWPNLKHAIELGLNLHRWSGSGEVVCTLLVSYVKQKS